MQGNAVGKPSQQLAECVPRLRSAMCDAHRHVFTLRALADGFDKNFPEVRLRLNGGSVCLDDSRLDGRLRAPEITPTIGGLPVLSIPSGDELADAVRSICSLAASADDLKDDLRSKGFDLDEIARQLAS